MKSDVFIHHTAVVDPGAVVGEQTRIWHFTHVMGGATLGARCVVGQNCFIGSGATVGNGVKLQNNVSVYDGVEIEDDVFLGPSAVLTNVANPRAFIERKDRFQKTLLRTGCTIGANATVICGVAIGRYALVGAGATVTRDVPSFALVVGTPARQAGWVGRSGNRLVFDSHGLAVDQEDGARYRLANESVEELHD